MRRSKRPPEATHWIFDDDSLVDLIESGEAVKKALGDAEGRYVALCGETVVPVPGATSMLNALDKQPADSHWVMPLLVLGSLIASARQAAGW